MAIDSNTILLLDMDGSDGDTTIFDTSSFAHGPITRNFTPELDDEQFAFSSGTSSIHNVQDYWKVPNHAIFDRFRAGDEFTLDFWVRFASLTADKGFIGQYQAGNKAWFFNYQLAAKLLNFEGRWPFQNIQATATWEPVIDTWYHLAFERMADGSLHLYILGDHQTLVTETQKNWTGAITGDVTVGWLNHNGHYHRGWLDEVRLSDVGRYGGISFTPETGPYGGPPVIPPAEVISVDKYYKQTQLPRIKKLRTNPGFTVTPGMEVAVPIKLDKWDHIKNVPARLKKTNPRNKGYFAFVDFGVPAAEVITLDKWYFQDAISKKRFVKTIPRQSEFMINFVESWQVKDGNWQDTGVFGFTITRTEIESATYKDEVAFDFAITKTSLEDFQLEDTEAFDFQITNPDVGNEVFNSGVPGFVSANVIINGVNESDNIQGVIAVTREDNTSAKFKCVLEFDQSLPTPRKPADLINKTVEIAFAAANMSGVVSDYIPIFKGICKHVSFNEDQQSMIMTGYDYGGVHQTKGEFISQNVTDVLTGTVGAGSAGTISLGHSPVWGIVWNGNAEVKDGEDYFVDTLNGNIQIPISSRVLQFPSSFSFNYMNPFASQRAIIQGIATIKGWTITEDNVTIADYSSTSEHPVISLSDESVIDICRKFLELSGAKVETNLFPKLRVYSEVQNVLNPPNTHVVDESDIFENSLVFRVDFDNLLNEQTTRSVQKVNASINIVGGQILGEFEGSEGSLNPFTFSGGNNIDAIDYNTAQPLVTHRIRKANINSLSFSSSGRFFLNFTHNSFTESISGASWSSFIDGEDFVIQLKHAPVTAGGSKGFQGFFSGVQTLYAFPAVEYTLTVTGSKINYGGGTVEDVKIVTAQRPISGVSDTLKGDVYENAYIETDQHCANICDAILLEQGNPYTCQFEVPVFVAKDMNIGDRIDIKRSSNVLFSGIIKTLNYTVNLTNGDNGIFVNAKGVGFGI